MKLYTLLPSPPCRAVMLFMQAINLHADMEWISLFKKDHLTPEYLALNPQHTVPLLDDDGFILTESRAIMGYLAEKYNNGSDSTYYPSDPKLKAVVNQRLMFDLTNLEHRFHEAYLTPFLTGEREINVEELGKLHEALGWLNAMMGDDPYMAGNKITIADFGIMATISSMAEIDVDLSPYPQILDWYIRCKSEMKNYEEGNGKGVKVLGDMLKGGLNGLENNRQKA